METSDSLIRAWDILQSEAPSGHGIVQRRVAAGSPHSAYATLGWPNQQPGFYLEITPETASGIAEDSARGFVLSKEWNHGSNRVRLILVASEKRFSELFRILACDVFRHVLQTNSADAGALALSMRLRRWKKFLQAAGESGLTQEQQVGLFGELVLLRLFIGWNEMAPGYLLDAWRGPLGESKDFLFGPAAIEVKTTVAADTSNIRISSEHQLDGQGLDLLFLAQVALNIIAEGGESLPEMVRSVGGLFGDDLEQDFMDRLGDAGYLESDAHMYSSRRYKLRFMRAFEVIDDFPRITANAVPKGASEVNYSIDISRHLESVIEVDALKIRVEKYYGGVL